MCSLAIKKSASFPLVNPTFPFYLSAPVCRRWKKKGNYIAFRGKANSRYWKLFGFLVFWFWIYMSSQLVSTFSTRLFPPLWLVCCSTLDVLSSNLFCLFLCLSRQEGLELQCFSIVHAVENLWKPAMLLLFCTCSGEWLPNSQWLTTRSFDVFIVSQYLLLYENATQSSIIQWNYIVYWKNLRKYIFTKEKSATKGLIC